MFHQVATGSLRNRAILLDVRYGEGLEYLQQVLTTLRIDDVGFRN